MRKGTFTRYLVILIIGVSGVVAGGYLLSTTATDHASAQDEACGFGSLVELSVWSNTDFCDHKYGAAQFLWGGVPRDGITPIYPPDYVYPDSVARLGGREAAYQVSYHTISEGNDYLTDQSPVLVVEINDDARAYPLGILTRHEIANTAVGGVPIAATFCPLCNTGVVFERVLDGQEYHFGVSGYLRNSDLVMWDHETESWWQQATGEGVVGDSNGKQLQFVSASMVSWGEFKETYPEGQVLAPPREGETYDYNPYAGYDSSSPFLYRGPVDERLPAMARVLNYVHPTDGEPIVVGYPFNVLEETIVANDVVLGEPLVAFWQPGAASALDSSRISESELVGSATLFERTLENGTVLTFVSDGNTIQDEQTGSTWNIFGQATDGELTGTQLNQKVATTHFWFAAQAFNSDIILWEADTTTDERLTEGGDS